MKSRSFKARIALTVSTLALTMAIPIIGAQPQTAAAAVPCGVYPSSKKLLVNQDKTITGWFKIDGEANCRAGATVMVWNADPSLQPKPEFWTTQTVHDIKSGTFAPGEYSYTVKLPVCATDPKIISGYQADVVADANPPHTLTPPGAGGWWDKRQVNGGYLVMDYKVAGDKCPAPAAPVVKPPVVTTPVKPAPAKPAPAKEAPVQVTPVIAPAPVSAPTPAPAPAAPEAPAAPVALETPETLPVTGPGGMLAAAGLIGTASAIGHNLVMRRRSHNS